MENLSLIIVIGFLILIVSHFFETGRNSKLIETATDLDRGNTSERKLVLALLKKGIHPDAIFHDLYLQKRKDAFSQIDVVVATAVGLIVIEVKEYSGWIYGSGNQTNWTQVMAYGRDKYRFYNPIMQNHQHIMELRRMSSQFASLPMFSVVVFYGDCEFKSINQIPLNTFFIKAYELSTTIDHILQNNQQAKYSNKREIIEVLGKAKANGADQRIVEQHINRLESMKQERNYTLNRNYFKPLPRSVSQTLRWLKRLR